MSQKDLISREALAEHFKGHISAAKNARDFRAADAWGGALWDVQDAPSVDAVPVVRCSECVHRGLPACPMCHDESYYDEDDGTEYYTVDKTDDNGFCHIGAKMDEEEADALD